MEKRGTRGFLSVVRDDFCDYAGGECTNHVLSLGESIPSVGTASARALRQKPSVAVAGGRCQIEVHRACAYAGGENQVRRRKGMVGKPGLWGSSESVI